MLHPVIHLRVEAPPKPPPGQPCNGCGVCCAWQPCPLGAVVSGRRHGACAALRWHEADRRYRCAMVDAPETACPAWPLALRGALKRLARRWIAAGAGCDCALEAQAAPE